LEFVNEIIESESSDHQDSESTADPNGSAAGFDGVNESLDAVSGAWHEGSEMPRKSESANSFL